MRDNQYLILKNGTRTSVCLGCGRSWEIVKHSSKGLCRGCARKSEYKNPEPKFLTENWDNQLIAEDLEQLLLPSSCDPHNLTKGSIVEITHKCDVCGEPKKTPFKLFIQYKNLSHIKCKSIKRQKTDLQKYGVLNHLNIPKNLQKREEENDKKIK